MWHRTLPPVSAAAVGSGLVEVKLGGSASLLCCLFPSYNAGYDYGSTEKTASFTEHVCSQEHLRSKPPLRLAL